MATYRSDSAFRRADRIRWNEVRQLDTQAEQMIKCDQQICIPARPYEHYGCKVDTLSDLINSKQRHRPHFNAGTFRRLRWKLYRLVRPKIYCLICRHAYTMTVIITSGSIAPDWPAYEGLSLCLTYLCLCPFDSYLYANL